MQTIYRPGQWYLIVIPGALVALPPDVPGDVVTQLWDRLPQEKTLATVIDVLTTHAGGSFTALPPFAAAVAEGADVRIALRGGVAARVSTDAEAKELSGAEVTTWSERFIARASRVEITVEQTEIVSGLPVQGAIVRAAAVVADLEPSDAEPLAGAQGPSPVVEFEAPGVSAAVLAGAEAPQLARFDAHGTEDGFAADAEEPATDATAPEAGTPAAEGPAEEVPEALAAAAGSESADPADAAPAAPEPETAAPAAPAPETAEPVTSDAAPEEEQVGPEDADVADPSASASEDSAMSSPADDNASSEMTLAPDDEDDFDQLWGATVHTAPAAAEATAPPAPPVVPAGAATAPAAPLAGDHDGATISAAELRRLRQQQAPVEPEAPTQVLPVTAGATAGAGRIRVSTGQVVALDRTVIIGRRPRSTRASGANLPHLVAVDSPQQDISRSHLEIRPEGDTVVVIDLHTTNGSTLLRPGADPVRLHPGEQTLVLSGDVVDLGDGVTVAFEDLP